MRRFVLCGLCGLLMCGVAEAQVGVREGGEKSRPARGPELRERVRSEAVKRFDKDRDGKLCGQERGEARAAVRERFEARRAELVSEFDADGDGKLDETERRSAFEARGWGDQPRFGAKERGERRRVLRERQRGAKPVRD